MAATRKLQLASPLRAGTIVAGKYRIERPIGEGGMGVVYEGFHLALEQRIAVKVVRSEYAHHSEANARFLDEARAIARLRGSHIAHVLDTGRTESGAPYMVLEYLEGQDLRALLDSEGPLPQARVLDYVLQTCEAIAEAHAVGIVHRDLKPENLFITRGSDGRDLIKVIDFGISKRLDDRGRSLTQHGQSLGSPHYMAPEQMTAPEQVDARADIWSLGVVLYELLSNSVPFSGGSVPEACVQVLNAKPRPLSGLRPDVSPELEAIVMRCLEKRKEDRYASIEELADALAAIVVPLNTRTRARSSSGCDVRPAKASSSTPSPEASRAERTLLSEAEPSKVAPENESSTRRSLEALPRRKVPAWLALGAAASFAGLILLGRVAPWLLREVANATSEPAEARAAEARRPQERPAAERERPSDATVGAPADAAASDAGPVVLPIDASMSENLALTQTLARPRPRPQRGLWASIKPAAAPQPASPASVTSKPLTTPAPAAPSGGDVGELMDPYARKPSQPGRVSALARGLTH